MEYQICKVNIKQVGWRNIKDIIKKYWKLFSEAHSRKGEGTRKNRLSLEKWSEWTIQRSCKAKNSKEKQDVFANHD